MRADAWPSQSASAEPAAGTVALSVVVAVLTYRRPDDLAELLPLLQAEAAHVEGAPEAAAGRASRVEVLVVDNDPGAGARDQVAALAAEPAAGSGASRVRYVHEPRAGIAAARNRALDEAGGFDVLVFVDDDERPLEGWLGLLLATHAEHDGCGVVGPVVSDFEVRLEDWVVMGGFFDRRRLPTGTRTDVAATNNLLLDVVAGRWCGATRPSSPTSSRPPARRGAGCCGGSSAAATRGAAPRSCSPARRPRGWRCGSGTTALGGGRLSAGLVRSVLGVVRGGLRDRAAGRKTAARGLGMLLGAWGYGYVEYRRAK